MYNLKMLSKIRRRRQQYRSNPDIVPPRQPIQQGEQMVSSAFMLKFRSSPQATTIEHMQTMSGRFLLQTARYQVLLYKPANEHTLQGMLYKAVQEGRGVYGDRHIRGSYTLDMPTIQGYSAMVIHGTRIDVQDPNTCTLSQHGRGTHPWGTLYLKEDDRNEIVYVVGVEPYSN